MLVLNLAGCATANVEEPVYFHRRFPEIHKILILPPRINVSEKTFQKDSNALLRESKQASEIAAQAVRAELNQRGFETKYYPEGDSFYKADPQLTKDLVGVLEKYENSTQDILTHFQGERTFWDEFPVSLGLDVNPLVDAAEADALLFVWGFSSGRSSGKFISDVVKNTAVVMGTFGMVYPEWKDYPALLNIALVDGDNGDILWANFTGIGQSFDLDRQAENSRKVKELFLNYPKK